MTVKAPAILKRSPLRLGFIPLMDAALLFVAAAQRLFQKHGLEVELSPEPSWANIRDKVALGALDGAHMLATMPLAATLGIGNIRKAQVTAFVLNLNGNAITVANHVAERMEAADAPACAGRINSARALKKVIDQDKAQGKAPLTFAVTFPFSTHNYELRYWMASAGIDPDRDVRLVVVPPHRMFENLASGSIDGYCVGDPWNQQSVLVGLGRIAVTTYELWNNRAEKVFAVNQDWADRNHSTHVALLMALLEAAQWIDRPENRLEAATFLARPEYVGASFEVLKLPLLGNVLYQSGSLPESSPDHIVFHRYAANFPWRSQAEWWLQQMRRWGHLDAGTDINAAADAVYRTDIYREAARGLDLPYPTIDRKPEGIHAGQWLMAAATGPIAMGPDAAFDGATFPATDSVPAQPAAKRDAIA